jgi:hypothetical protein
MSLVKFERFLDRIAPSLLLVLGLFAAGATATLGA